MTVAWIGLGELERAKLPSSFQKNKLNEFLLTDYAEKIELESLFLTTKQSRTQTRKSIT